MNWGRVDVFYVDDPAAVVLAQTGVWQLAGFVVDSKQIGEQSWLCKAVNGGKEIVAAQLLLGPDIPPPPPQPFWLDSFTDADGANLVNHTSEISNTYMRFLSNTGGATIQSNMVQADAGGGANFIAVCQDLPLSGNYSLSLGIKVAGTVGVSDYASLHGRLTSGAVPSLPSGYEARVSANAITLYRWTDGMLMELGSATWTPADGILSLICKKSVIAVQWNSAEVIAVVDATYPTGRVGMGADGAGFRIDNAVGQEAPI